MALNTLNTNELVLNIDELWWTDKSGKTSLVSSAVTEKFQEKVRNKTHSSHQNTSKHIASHHTIIPYHMPHHSDDYELMVKHGRWFYETVLMMWWWTRLQCDADDSGDGDGSHCDNGGDGDEL